MSSWRHDSLKASPSEPLPVVIIGNGPSGICLSYLLSGHIPYVKPGAVHPHPLLQRKLAEAPGVSILDQDLEYLSEGLEGRSQSPVALLFDALLRPDTDFGGNMDSVLSWKRQKELAVPHLVLGRNLPGGAWHSIEGSMVTLSQGQWMSLPDLQVKDWMRKKCRGLRNSRATAGDIALYYRDYVTKKGLSQNFVSGAVVTAVEWAKTEHGASEAQVPRPLFQVRGYLTAKDHSRQPFSLWARNVVLATGTFDSPAMLGIPGETLPFVHHELSALEAALRAGTVNPASDPVLIVGAGLSAADAVLFARHYNIQVIHAFRRSVHDPGLVFNQLPKMLYPEYHKVQQMMREHSEARLAVPLSRLVVVLRGGNTEVLQAEKLQAPRIQAQLHPSRHHGPCSRRHPALCPPHPRPATHPPSAHRSGRQRPCTPAKLNTTLSSRSQQAPSSIMFIHLRSLAGWRGL